MLLTCLLRRYIYRRGGLILSVTSTDPKNSIAVDFAVDFDVALLSTVDVAFDVVVDVVL